MSEKLYKAVRPDGTDFRTGKTDYLAGGVITHPKAGPNSSRTDATFYFSVSTSKTDCTGFSWPARLLEVEAVGDVWTPHPEDMPNKRAVVALRVVRELPAVELLGPQGENLLALVARCRALTYGEARKLGAAWGAAWGAARGARDAAWGAARDAAWGAAWDAARDAARALLSRDLIGQAGFTQERYDLLSGPWRRVVGRIHPDDVDLFESTDV